MCVAYKKRISLLWHSKTVTINIQGVHTCSCWYCATHITGDLLASVAILFITNSVLSSRLFLVVRWWCWGRTKNHFDSVRVHVPRTLNWIYGSLHCTLYYMTVNYVHAYAFLLNFWTTSYYSKYISLLRIQLQRALVSKLRIIKFTG